MIYDEAHNSTNMIIMMYFALYCRTQVVLRSMKHISFVDKIHSVTLCRTTHAAWRWWLVGCVTGSSQE